MSSHSIACAQCQATLKYQDDLFGKTLNCPRCQAEVTIPFPDVVAFEDDEPLTLADVIEEESSSAAPNTTASPAKAKKKKKKKPKKAGWEMPAIAVEPIVWQGLFGILGIGLFVLAIWYLARWPDAPLLEAELWKEHVTAPYFKVSMPGTTKKETQNQAGMSMQVLNAQPKKEAIFGIAYSSGWLPAGRINDGVETILNDACNGSAANLEAMGAVEVGRKSIKLKNFAGKQLTMKISQAKGYMIMRAYMVGPRLYIAMVGGRGLHEKHPDVVKFFDSFEITEEPAKAEEKKDPVAPTKESPPPATGNEPPAPPPLKGSTTSGEKKLDPANIPPGQPATTSPEGQTKTPPPPPKIPEMPQAPYAVDPVIKPGLATIYLSDLTEFGTSRSPTSWGFGKKGSLNSPYKHERIVVQGKTYEQGLSTHPDGAGYRWCVYYAVGGKATRLRGAVAIDDTGSSRQGHFAIIGDGKTLWESKNQTDKGSSEPFDVDVSGVKVLSLQCWCDTSIHGCHCVWLDPQLTLVEGKK